MAAERGAEAQRGPGALRFASPVHQLAKGPPSAPLEVSTTALVCAAFTGEREDSSVASSVRPTAVDRVGSFARTVGCLAGEVRKLSSLFLPPSLAHGRTAAWYVRKPFRASHPVVYCSLSRSSDRVLCGQPRQREVGC